jgi:hypothetical protein
MEQVHNNIHDLFCQIIDQAEKQVNDGVDFKVWGTEYIMNVILRIIRQEILRSK